MKNITYPGAPRAELDLEATVRSLLRRVEELERQLNELKENK